MLKRMNTTIDYELTKKLSEIGFKKFASELIRKEMSSNFQHYFKDVIEATLDRMRKKVNFEVNNSRQLLNSLDYEIQKTVKSIPLSHNFEKEMGDKIKNQLDSLFSNTKKQLSDSITEPNENKLIMERGWR
jgi:hypothetical protein